MNAPIFLCPYGQTSTATPMSSFHKIKRSSVAFQPRDRTVPRKTTVVAGTTTPTSGGTTTIIYQGGGSAGGVGGNVSTDWIFTERSDGTLVLNYKDRVVHAFQGGE